MDEVTPPLAALERLLSLADWEKTLYSVHVTYAHIIPSDSEDELDTLSKPEKKTLFAVAEGYEEALDQASKQVESCGGFLLSVSIAHVASQYAPHEAFIPTKAGQ